MSKLSDSTQVTTINDDDEVVMLRPSGAVYVNIRAAVQYFVSEVFGLIGAETIDWSSLVFTDSDLSDLANRSHTDLTDIGSNSHAQIDAFMSAHSSAKFVTFAPVESDFDVKIREGTIAFTVPALLNGFNLTDVLISVHTPGTGTGATSIQIRRRRAGTDADMLGTRVTIGVDEYYANDGVINTSYDDLATGDQIYADVDQLTSTPPTGLSITLTVNIP
jgi:hypothetical protein